MSTGTTNKGEARIIAQRAGEVGTLARNKQLTPEKARRVADDIVSAVLRSIGHKTEGMKTRAYFSGWLKEKERVGAESTFDSYSGIVAKFLEYLGCRADDSLSTINKADIVTFRDSLMGKVSPSRVNNYLKVLRVGFGRAVKEELIERNPVALVDNLKTHGRSARRAFTLPELKKLFDAAQDEWRTLLMVGLYTGLRLQDAASLTWENIDLREQELTICTGKTGRMVIAAIARPLLNHIEQNVKAGDDPKAPLCPTLKGRGSSWLSNQFYLLMASAKLVPERTHQTGVELHLKNKSVHKGWIKRQTKTALVIETRAGEVTIEKDAIRERRNGKGRDGRRALNEIGFHALRHTATSLMKNAGVPASVVMDIIGHESEAVSRNYTHIDRDAKRKALNSIPDIVELCAQSELGFGSRSQESSR
jgi:integrase